MPHDLESRRRFLRRAAYASPLILSLAVRPLQAGTGYGGGGGGTCGVPTRPSRGGGNKDAHAWYRFWRKL